MRGGCYDTSWLLFFGLVRRLRFFYKTLVILFGRVGKSDDATTSLTFYPLLQHDATRHLLDRRARRLEFFLQRFFIHVVELGFHAVYNTTACVLLGFNNAALLAAHGFVHRQTRT